ncbi:MAG: sarcosine oxidase subunit gamma [Carbonactinosporaceae bacterium]
MSEAPAPASTGTAAAEPVARSPITPAPPVVVQAGWEVSGRRSTAALTLTDCTPLVKIQVKIQVRAQVKAGHGGALADLLGAGFGRAARDRAGALVVGSGPGEWLALAGPGTADALRERLAAGLAGMSGTEGFVSVVDLTHGRALVRLSGMQAGDVLAKVCGIDLRDGVTPHGSALRTSVAGLVTDLVRDDRGGTRGGTLSYLLHCERSSGQYLFEALIDAGEQFGIDVDGFRPPESSWGT